MKIYILLSILVQSLVASPTPEALGKGRGIDPALQQAINEAGEGKVVLVQQHHHHHHHHLNVFCNNVTDFPGTDSSDQTTTDNAEWPALARKMMRKLIVQLEADAKAMIRPE